MRNASNRKQVVLYLLPEQIDQIDGLKRFVKHTTQKTPSTNHLMEALIDEWYKELDQKGLIASIKDDTSIRTSIRHHRKRREWPFRQIIGLSDTPTRVENS